MAKKVKYNENPNIANNLYNISKEQTSTIIRSRVEELIKIDPDLKHSIGDIDKIAEIYTSRLLDLNGDLSKASMIYGSYNKKNYASTTSVGAKAHEALYKKLEEKNFFKDVVNAFGTNKTQTPQELQAQAVSLIPKARLAGTGNVLPGKSNSMNWGTNYNNLLGFANVKNGVQDGFLITLDTETLSGLSSLGHDSLEHITEMSATVHGFSNGKMNRVLRIDSVLGFDETQYVKALERLDEIKRKGVINLEKGSSDAVFFERMNIYGTVKTSANGFEHNITEAKGINDISTSIDNAKKGIEKLREVGKSQSNYLLRQGSTIPLHQAQKDYVGEVNRLISTGEYRGQKFDNYYVLGQNSSNFDLPKQEAFSGVKIDKSRHIDMLQLNMMSQEYLGHSSILPTGTKTSGKYGRATQENISSSLGYKVGGKAAHIALTDEEELARMMVQPINGNTEKMLKEIASGSYDISNNSYFDLLLKNASSVNEKVNATAYEFSGKNDLFFMDYTMQKNWNNKNGALNFAYDPVTKKFKTFDGYEIGDGVRNTGYSQFGAKKGSLVTHEAITVSSTDQLKDMFKDIKGLSNEQAELMFQNISKAEELYLIKTQEYIDMAALEKKVGKEAAQFYYDNRQTIYTIETNKERIGANLGYNVGKLDDNGNIVSVNKSSVDAIGLQKTAMVDDKVISQALNTEDAVKALVDKSIDRTVNDSAARNIRELNYEKINKLIRFEKNNMTESLKNPLAHHALQYADAVTKGAVNLKIQDELGYVFNLEGHGSKKMITPETVRNAVALESYIQEMNPIFDDIENILDEKYGKFDWDAYNKNKGSKIHKEAYMRRELGFKQLLNDYVNEVSNGSNGGIHTSRDLNKVDFNIKDIMPGKFMSTIKTSGNSTMDNILSLDLNNGNSLINLFFNGKFGDVEERVNKNSAAGWTALEDAFDAFNSDNRFNSKDNHIWKGISVNKLREDGYSVLQVNDIMTERIKEYVGNKRQDDSSFGLLHARNVQSVIDPESIKELSRGQSAEDRLSTLKKLSGNLKEKDNIILAGSNDKNTINKLVNEYFMGYTEADFNKATKGFSESQIEVLKLQDRINRHSAESYAQQLIESISGEDNLAYMITKSNGKPILNIVNNGEVTRLDAMRFTMNNGLLNYSIGDNEYVNRLMLTQSRKGEPILTTAAEKVRSRRVLTQNIQWGKDRGESAGDIITRTIKEMNEGLRNATTRVDFSNGQMFAQSFMLDVNETIKMLPSLEKSGVLKTIEENLKIKEENRSVIRDIIKNVNRDPNYYNDKAFTKVLPRELNHYMSFYHQGVMENIAENINVPNGTYDNYDIYKKIIKTSGAKSKTQPYRAGLTSLDDVYYMDPLALLDDEKRPPMTQLAGGVLYDKEEIIERSKELGINASSGPVATNNLAEKFLYNNISKTGQEATAGAMTKFLQIGTTDLQEKFLRDKAAGESGELSKFLKTSIFKNVDKENAEKVIMNRALQLSTYEQQGLVNSRLSDTSFHKFNTQKINSTKEMLLNIDSDLETITYVKNAPKLDFSIKPDGTIAYNNGVHVRSGETLGRFGNADFSEIKTARYDGIFRGRFFNEQGNVVGASKINELLKQHGVSGEQATREFLYNNFQYKYEVMPVREMHGMKVQMGPSEKTTTDSMKMAVGSWDKGLAEELDKVGFGHLNGGVTYADYLYNDVKTELDNIGRSDLWTRILNERHSLSDYVGKLTGNAGFISAVNIDKHNSVSIPMHSFLYNLQQAGEITDDNMSSMFGKGNYEINNGRVNILSMDKVNLTFKEGSALDNIYKKTMSDFKKGEGYVNVVQTYDDISGTSSGLVSREVADNINTVNNKIKKYENLNEINSRMLEKRAELLREKERLQQVIQDVDVKAQIVKHDMLQQISRDVEQSKSAIDTLNEKISALYAKKELTHYNLASTDGLMDSNDPYKVGQRRIMADLDEQIAEYKNIVNSHYSNISTLNKADGLKKIDQDLIDVRLSIFPEISNLSKGNNYIKDISSGKSFSILDLSEDEITNIINSNNDHINVLKSEKVNLQKQAEAMSDFKGLKFSNAMGLNLDRATFNPDIMKKLQGELSPEDFQKYFGYAMDGDGISSEFLGSRIAGPVTDNLRRQLLLRDGDIKLSEVRGNKRLNEQYGYLVDAVESAGGSLDGVSVSTAENMYSYTQGKKAMRYNESHSFKDKRALLENKLGDFNEVNYSDLELDINGQGRQITKSANNPYTNNLIIKTGLGGEFEDIALARMPEVHTGDSLVKKPHVKQLSQLKEVLTQYHGTDDIEKKERYYAKALDVVNNIKSLQKADITSKTGLIRQGVEYRMDQSFFGKASGININSFAGDKDLFGIVKKGMSAEEAGKLLRERNPHLAQYQYDGKSILDHYAEGKVVDSVFVNEKAFEDMGYFDKNKMNETFSNLTGEYKDKLNKAGITNFDSYDDQRKAMRYLLSTEGDSFLTVRYPEIREDSDKFSMLFLNNDLKDNQVQVLGATGMNAKLDHDGDSFAAALVKDMNGGSKLSNAMTGKYSDIDRAVDSSIIARASTNNVYWENEVKKHIKKEGGFASSVEHMREVAGKRYINGELYTTRANTDMSIEELEGLQEKYREVLKKDTSSWKKTAGDQTDLINDIISKSGGLNQEEALNEYIAAWSYSDTKDMITAKVYQNAVGETNVTNAKVKSLVTGLLDKASSDYEYKSMILGDFLYRAEEGAISSKTSVEGLEPDRAKNWNDAVVGVLKGENVEKNKVIMKQWLVDNVQKDAFIGSYYARSSHFSDYINESYGINSFGDFEQLLKKGGKEKEAIMNKITDDVVDIISSAENKDKMSELLDTLRLGVSQTGASERVASNPLFIAGQDTNLRTFMEGGARLFGEEFAEIKEIKPYTASSSKAFRASVDETIEQAAKSSSTSHTAQSIIEGIGDLSSSKVGKNLAKGAIGVAASILVAGFVGGRPRPADVHAMEEATDYQTPMEGHSLADPGMSQVRGQQGYVVNINARTNKGRDNAIQALQQAIANGGSSNVNISMNITDNYGNINDRAIEEAIIGAF